MEKKESILLELQYLPPVQYFTKFLKYDFVIIEQHEHYTKGSYRNRCHIAGANGILRLSIPLQKGKNEQLPIQEVAIAYNQHWQSHHWASIRSAYGNAPFFDHYAIYLEPFFKNKNHPFLFQFNSALLECILSLLQITTTICYTTEYKKDLAENVLDFRGGIHPKKHSQQTDYHFLDKPYPQIFIEKNDFLPNLSILDLLFCTGPQAPLLLEEMIIDKT